MNKDTIGIDISKDTLDAHHLSTGAAAQFANSAAGLRALRRWIGAQMPDLVVYEATGAYHADLERGFAGVLPLVKVNPLQARRFAQARGTRAKTDAVDARVLAVMGSALDLAPDVPAGKNQHDLKELQIARMALIKERTRLLNRSKTQSLALLKRQSTARLEQIKRQLTEELSLKVGDGEIGWHIKALFTRRSSRREKDIPHDEGYGCRVSRADRIFA